MRILGISNHGLAVIATLVAVLWGVIFMERAFNQRAERDYQELRHSLQATPASTPSPTKPALPSVG